LPCQKSNWSQRARQDSRDIDLRRDKIDQVYGVQVRPAGASSLEELTVMHSKDWVQAIEMSHLVRWFQIGCSADDAASPSNPHPV